MTPENNGAIAFAEKYDALSKLYLYPPFSTDFVKSEEFATELSDEASRVNKASFEALNSGADIGSPEHAKSFEGAFVELEMKWGDDLDIARLYMKRYGDDWYEAQEEALRLEGRSPSDADVPSL